MKKVISMLMLSALAGALIVSCKQEDPEPEPQKEYTLTVKTGGAEVDESDVTISGSYTYDGTESVVTGFRYATDKTALSAAEFIEANAIEGKFSTSIKSLANGEYWYQAVAKVGDKEVAGVEGLFKIDLNLVPTLTTGVADLTTDGYVLTGSYTFSSKKTPIKVGFIYAGSEDALAGAQFTEVNPSEGNITLTVPYSIGTNCFYQAAAIVGDVTYKGEVKSAGMANLSATGRANCYIVAEAGWYCFDAKKVDGNAVEGDKADWAWATEEGLVSNISYADGVIKFKAEKFSQGNVVIALLNGSAIAWSWNIWFTDAKDQTLNGVTFMDRNLGATALSANEPGSIGLMYQFGRKDPFIGTKIMDKTIATSLYESVAFSLDESKERCWCAPYVVNTNVCPDGFKHVGEEMDEAKATANPMVHYGKYNAGGYSMNNATIADFWGGVSGNKTNNDPCPVGYKVASFTDYKTVINDFLLVSTNGAKSQYGVTKDGKQTWGRIYTLDGVEYNWPATGWRAWSGVIARPGNVIALNSCNLSDGTNGSTATEKSMQVYWNWGATPGKNYIVEAFPLRCVKK